MYDIITFGSNTLDVFVKTDSELIEIKNKFGEEELIAYPLGSKIIINELEFMIGGGGTNTAVAFRRLGLKTAYVGKIGKDENGLKIFKVLKEEKIDFLGAVGGVSGYSVILDSIDEDRTILTYRGCNADLRINEIDLNKLKTKWIYCSSMLNKSFETLKKIIKYANKNSIKIAFNVNTFLANKGFSYLKAILENINALILNKDEAELIVGKGTIPDLMERLKLDNMDYVVITDGKKGAHCYDGSNLYFVKPNKGLKVKETTGAGDSFASSFIAGLIMGKSVEDCLRMAIINSESIIQNYGAKNILLKKSAMMKLLKKDDHKITKKKINL